MPPRISYAPLCLFALIGLVGGLPHESLAQQPASPAAAPIVKVTSPAPSLGIGAIGQIEPRSRVIHLSHDQDMNASRIEEIRVAEGQDVEKGEIVAVFSDYGRRESEISITQARLETLRARKEFFAAEIEDATANFKRISSLVKQSAVSQSAFDTAKARLTKAKADAQANIHEIAAAEVDLTYSKQRLEQSLVRSTIAGTILKIHAWPGERVEDGRIADIADLTHLDVVAEVYESDMPRVKVGQKARVILAASTPSYEAEVRELGYLVQKNDLNDTDPLADRDNRVIEVRLTLPETANKDLRHQIYRQVQVQIFP